MAILTMAPNFHLGLVVGPLPRDLKLDAPWTVLRKLELKLSPLQIDPLLAFLPSSTGTTIERALVEADLNIVSPEASAKFQIAAKGGLRGLTLRLLEMGFVPGTVVTLIKRAPFGDPLEFQVRGCHVSLRAAEARCVRTVTP